MVFQQPTITSRNSYDPRRSGVVSVVVGLDAVTKAGLRIRPAF